MAEAPNDEMEIDLFGMLLRLAEKWKLICKVALILAVIGLLYAGVTGFLSAREELLEPTYNATAKIYVVSNIPYSEGSERSELELSEYLLADCREVIMTRDVRENADIRLLELGYGYYEADNGEKVRIKDLVAGGEEDAIEKAVQAYKDDLVNPNKEKEESDKKGFLSFFFHQDDEEDMVPQIAGGITVSIPGNTRLIYISVSGADETGLAKDMANTYADLAVQYIPQLLPGMQASIFQYAREPKADEVSADYGSIRGKMISSALMFFVVGALLVCVLLAVRFFFDDKVRSGEEIEKYLAMPVMGVVPMMEDPEKVNQPKKERSKK